MLGRSLSLDKTLGVLESLTGAFLRLTVADGQHFSRTASPV
jgi:hypothetical protein